MKKIVVITAAAMVLLSSCYSTGEGAINGAMFGSIAGGAIGGIMGGHYGHDVGTLVGMAAGGAAGAAAGHAEEKKRMERVERLHRRHVERERAKQEKRARKERARMNATNSADDIYYAGASKSLDAARSVSVDSLMNHGNARRRSHLSDADVIGTYNASNGSYVPKDSVIISKPVEGTLRSDDQSGFDPTNSGNDVIDFE